MSLLRCPRLGSAEKLDLQYVPAFTSNVPLKRAVPVTKSRVALRISLPRVGPSVPVVISIPTLIWLTTVELRCDDAIRTCLLIARVSFYI